jgi:hypothetical protein
MANTTLNPSGEGTTTNWNTTGANHWSVIVRTGAGVSDAANNGTYVDTTTLGSPLEILLQDAPLPANLSGITKVEMNVRAQIVDASNQAVIEGSLYKANTTQVGTTIDLLGGDLSGGYGAIGFDEQPDPKWHWDELNGSLTTTPITKADGDLMQFHMTFAAAA